MNRPSIIGLLLLVIVCVEGCGRSGSPTKPPRELEPPAEPTRFARMSLDLVDDTIYRWWWVNTKGEFYLKIESSLEPDAAVLIPVNVGQAKGARCCVRKTPLYFRGNTETLTFELLHERSFSDEMKKRILDVCDSGGVLVWTAGKLVLLRNPNPESLQKDNPLSTLARATGECIFQALDEKPFKSMGMGKCVTVKEPPEDEKSANPLFILDNDRGTKRMEIRAYYPKR